MLNRRLFGIASLTTIVLGAFRVKASSSTDNEEIIERVPIWVGIWGDNWAHDWTESQKKSNAYGQQFGCARIVDLTATDIAEAKRLNVSNRKYAVMKMYRQVGELTDANL